MTDLGSVGGAGQSIRRQRPNRNVDQDILRPLTAAASLSTGNAAPPVIPSRIVFSNEQLSLDPPCPEIAAKLSNSKRIAVPDDVHGYLLRAHRESLLDPAVPRPNAGLVPAVCRLLSKSGCSRITLRRSSGPPADLPAPNVGSLGWFGVCDPELLALVRAADHGLIRYNTRGGADLAWLIAQIALAYPQATLAVVTASRDFGHQLRRRISRWIRGVDFLDARPSARPVGRVVIGTPYGMAANAVEFNKRNFLFFPRAEDALHERSQTALTTVDPRFRLFGFMPTDCKLSPYEQDWIRATFGFDEVTIPRHGFVERPVRTVWLPIDGGPRVPNGLGLLELKRRGVWYHPVRNRRIARIAGEFSNQNANWLGTQMSEFAAREGSAAACSVLLLVEGVEHAIALADLLPGWPMILGDGVIEDGLSRRQRQLLAARQATSLQVGPAIATVAGLSRPGALDLNAVDVLIWGGAGAHLPPLPADQLICRPEQARALLLVDFNDRHHPQLRRWSRCRREAYPDAGWIAPGADPVRVRVDRFLAKRPGRRLS